MESRTGIIPRPLNAVVIGSGNVASAIVPALESAGAIRVSQIYSPTLSHARALADKLSAAVAVCDPASVSRGADLYLVAVKDDVISSLATPFKDYGGVWLHTSGGVECSVMEPITADYGVLYPLQTFSKGREVDLSQIPVFVEGATPRAIETSRFLAQAISPKVYDADGTTRSRLHAAAVFACNFTNHLWAIADDILRREAAADLSVLAPLIRETVDKALSSPPAMGQTGPAVRGDRKVIDHHKSLLNAREAELYEILSSSIIHYHNECDRL
ncbi:MAG: DUF2520 domain-containing protein [Barnesiella sp.]|nr:DUF2520 domain-containing protein [Barnesiella sp.]